MLAPTDGDVKGARSGAALGYDLRRITEDYQRQESASGAKVVTRRRRKPVVVPPASPA